MSNSGLLVVGTGLTLLFLWVYFFVRAYQLKKPYPWGFLIVIVGVLISGHGIHLSSQSLLLQIDLLFIVMLLSLFWNINDMRILVANTKLVLIRSLIGCCVGLILGMAMDVVSGVQNVQINEQYSLTALLVISIQTSLAEELLFRGVLLKYLLDFHFNDIFANLIQSVLFAVLHIPRYSGNWTAIFIMFFSAYFAGYLTIKYQSLFSAFSIHITINVIAVIIWWNTTM